MPSPIMQALYEGRRDAAIAMATKVALDQFEAAALGDPHRLRDVLAEEGAHLDRRSDDGFSALHFAAFFGTSEAAAVLIDAGADVSSVSASDMHVQPLHSAAASRSTSISRLLLDAGAPPDARQTGGYTPLHEAALHADVELIELLLQHGARADIRNDDGRTPADLARAAGHDEIANQLEARLTS
jgi:ankyrin repeat protein